MLAVDVKRLLCVELARPSVKPMRAAERSATVIKMAVVRDSLSVMVILFRLAAPTRVTTRPSSGRKRDGSITLR